jgi:hypothetical protein
MPKPDDVKDIEKDEVVDKGTVPTAPTITKSDSQVIVKPTSVVEFVEAPKSSINGSDGVTIASFAGGTLGGRDTGDTPIGVRTRQGDREGRIRAYDVELINRVVSERAVPVFMEEADITEGTVQGTRRRKNANQLTLIRKNADTIQPADTAFHRSLDLLIKDKVVSTQGMCFDDPAFTDVYPVNNESTPGTTVANVNTLKRSNYLLRSLTITNDAGVPVMTFDVEELDIGYESGDGIAIGAEIIDASFVTMKPKLNEVANARLDIVHNASDEASQNWSPLGEAINEPEGNLTLAADLEASAGSIVAAATKSVQQSLAFQLNLLGKDGNISAQPMSRHLLGGFGNEDEDYDVMDDDAQLSLVRIIEFHDSLRKYNTKGDILSQRRSLGMIADKLLNNAEGFYIRPEYKKYLDAASALGLDSSTYQSDQPVLGIQKMYLIDSLDPSQYAVYEDGTVAHTTWYAYSEERNNYRTEQGHDVFDGIYRWLVKNWTRFQDVFDVGTDEDTIVIPIEFDFMFGNTFSYLVGMAIDEINQCRLESKREIDEYAENFVYPFNWLKPLKDFPIMSSDYANFSNRMRALELKQLPEHAVLDFLAPETMPLVDEFYNTEEATYGDYRLMPWYMNYGAYTYDTVTDTWIWDYSMNWPSIRKGINSDVMIRLANFGSEAYRKTFDIITFFPGHTAGEGIGEDYLHTFEVGADEDLCVVQYEDDPTLGDLFRIPRALGYSFDAPGGYAFDADLTDEMTASGTYRVVVWAADGDPTGRGQAYHQLSYVLDAGAVDADQETFIDNTQVILGMNQAALEYAANGGVTPFLENTAIEFASFAPLMYTLMTKVMFFQNPFDQMAEEDTLADAPLAIHPFEIAMWFGLVGFRKSEFSEEITLEYNAKIEEGLNYVAPKYLLKNNKYLG